MYNCNCNTVQAWYVTVALNKTFAVMWIHQMKKILLMCCENLKGLKVCCKTFRQFNLSKQLDSYPICSLDFRGITNYLPST